MVQRKRVQMFSKHLGFFFLKEALGLSEICFPYDAVT